MQTRHITIFAILTAILAGGCSMPEPFRVMSYNLRQSNWRDADTVWPQRRNMLAKRVEATAPDILAVQEISTNQAAELWKDLSDYGFVGVGCKDGVDGGRQVPILYRRERFTLVDCGDDPLGPTARGGVCGSPHVATWARLKFNDSPMREVRVINVQLDDQSCESRIKAAEALKKMLDDAGEMPVVLVGDFQCVPGSKPYAVLTADGTVRTIVPDAQAPTQTLSGMLGGMRSKAASGPCEWILVNGRFDVTPTGCGPLGEAVPVVADLRLIAVETGFT